MADSREIVLNVYDFDDVPASRFLAWMKCGIHHSAVMIGNREWTFSDAGVFTMRPRAAPRCTIRVLWTQPTLRQTRRRATLECPEQC